MSLGLLELRSLFSSTYLSVILQIDSRLSISWLMGPCHSQQILIILCIYYCVHYCVYYYVQLIILKFLMEQEGTPQFCFRFTIGLLSDYVLCTFQ